MNAKQLSELSREDFQILVETPLFISLLIAYADENVNDRETEWAPKVAKFRTNTAHHSLQNYYGEVFEIKEAKFSYYVDKLKIENQEDRMNFLVDQISRVNSVLVQLDQDLKENLYKSFLTLARSVAEVDEGILDFFRSNPLQDKWLGLNMIEKP
ncbi:MAG: hypothetical protein MUE53_03755 [Chitinophagales bacterium]|jgi:hypothetical protein|nr:hypothetical protein [Chitinophagales bacterium]